MSPPTDERVGRARRPGPRRPKGSPAGPEAVIRALLDATSDLIATKAANHITLREIARAADVQVALISRYIGSRDDLLDAVFDELTVAVAHQVVDHPLEQVSFERGSAMGRWTELLAYLVRTRPSFDRNTSSFNPVQALARVIEESYGLDPVAARVRGAQIVSSALGWRIFEAYLIAAGDLGDVDRATLRDELTALHRQIGASPWPAESDPPLRARDG